MFGFRSTAATLDTAKRVAEAVQEARKSHVTTRDHYPDQMSKEDMIRIGHMLWEMSYAKDDDDKVAFNSLFDELAKRDDQTLAAAIAVAPDQLMLTGLARWADQGYPTIQVGHKYAAALLATHVSADVCRIVEPPWRALMIEIPEEMLPTLSPEGECFVRRVLVQRIHVLRGDEERRVWQYIAMADGPACLWRHGVTGEELAEPSCWDNGVWEGFEHVKPVEGIDRRTTALIGRLILNVCLAMSDPANVKRPSGAGGVGSVPKERGNCAGERRYQIGKPIKLDCRGAVEAFIRGRTHSAPSVQTLVRGHWKPKLGARLGRPVWVLPYWRGDLDAPILVRPVTLGMKDASKEDVLGTSQKD